jgi:cobalamin biosynthesis protein CobW
VVRLPVLGSLKELEQRVAEAMATPGVLRIKGAAEVAGKAAPAMVQAVGPRVETWFAKDARAPGQVVVIGLAGFDLARIEGLLARAVAA